MASKLAEIGAVTGRAAPANSWCDGKAAFESAHLAHAVQARRGRRQRTHRKVADVYRCGTCGRWHIGTVEPWQERGPGSR